jgi:hypothetical protein
MASSSLDIYSRVFGGEGSAMPSNELPRLNDSDEDEELAQRVMRDMEGSEGAFRSWENGAREEDQYYHGSQWDDADRMRMEQLKRPVLTLNEIKPIVNAVSGLERLNRVDVRAVTRALDSPLQLDLTGDLASEAVSAADDLCNAAEEDSDLSKKAIITGMGWGEIKCDYNTDINGRVTFEHISNYEMRWDSNCKRPNLEGRGWCGRKRQFSRKEFKKHWPDMLEKVDLTIPDMPYGQTEKYEMATPYYSLENERLNPQVGGQTHLKKTIEVIQYQWKEMEPIYRFQDQDSEEITTLNEDKWERLKDRMQMAESEPPPAVKQLQPVYKQVYICRGVVLEPPTELPGGFSLICLTGEYNEEKKRFVGIVRDMMDPQRLKNKAISSALGFHTTNAKGGVMFKTSAFADPDHAKDQWSRYDAFIEVSDEADITKDIVQRAPAKISPDLGMFYQEGTKSFTRVTGINEEMVGQGQGTQTPAGTTRSRQSQGLVVLGWFWDNLARHHRERFTVMLDFIREYWTQGQLMQVGGDTSAQSIPLLKENLPDRWAYTMVLDESLRHNPDLKAQLWHEMMDSGALQWFLKAGLGSVVLALLKYSPWPAYVVKTIQQTVAQNPPQPPQKGQKGGGKQEAPQLTQAKVGLMGAQQQKALAQARSIDQQMPFKQADLTAKTVLDAHRIAAENRKTAMQQKMKERQQMVQQLAKQTGFYNDQFAGGTEDQQPQ